ncbi:MAG: hypothetical protein ABFD97_11730 [Syntrophobacter sp.]
MLCKLIVNAMALLILTSGSVYAADSSMQTGTTIPSGTVAGGPCLVVPDWSFDFGEVKEGAAYIHTFEITNIGTEVLEIKKIIPG